MFRNVLNVVHGGERDSYISINLMFYFVYKEFVSIYKILLILIDV